MCGYLGDAGRRSEPLTACRMALHLAARILTVVELRVSGRQQKLLQLWREGWDRRMSEFWLTMTAVKDTIAVSVSRTISEQWVLGNQVYLRGQTRTQTAHAGSDLTNMSSSCLLTQHNIPKGTKCPRHVFMHHGCV